MPIRSGNFKCLFFKKREDIFVVEGMQKGRQGDMFDGGKFSPVMDGPTHTFHRWIATQIITQRKLSQRGKNIEEIVE